MSLATSFARAAMAGGKSAGTRRAYVIPPQCGFYWLTCEPPVMVEVIEPRIAFGLARVRWRGETMIVGWGELREAKG
jgi:hypothetical protein